MAIRRGDLLAGISRNHRLGQANYGNPYPLGKGSP
jgi:hypothetical protein